MDFRGTFGATEALGSLRRKIRAEWNRPNWMSPTTSCLRTPPSISPPPYETTSIILAVVRPERFELPASWFVARRSIQLSYGRKDDQSPRCGSPQHRTAHVLWQHSGARQGREY